MKDEGYFMFCIYECYIYCGIRDGDQDVAKEKVGFSFVMGNGVEGNERAYDED